MQDPAPFSRIWLAAETGALPGIRAGTPVLDDAGKLREAVEAHVNRHIGTPDVVLCEEVSQVVELEVHCIAPRGNRGYWTLVTNGMSAQPMVAPEGMGKHARTELMLCLPPEWRPSIQTFSDERVYWPIRLLKNLARFPHLYKIWFGHGHTIPHKGEFPQVYAEGVPFCGAILGVPTLFPAEFTKLPQAGFDVRFHALFPLYREEMNFKLKKGADPLFRKFRKCKISELVDLQRGNVCAGKRSREGLLREWS